MRPRTPERVEEKDAPVTHGALYVSASGDGAAHGGWHGRRHTALPRPPGG
ncbi:hypothetical protein [Streptomyces sp. NPDC056628]